MRIVLFYCGVDSFNFFSDCLDKELKQRGHETFILDLRNPPESAIHSFSSFEGFILSGVDAVICFDAFAIRNEINNVWTEIWNVLGTTVIDIFMDPPLRFHPVFLNPPKKYHLFCCDWEHVEYVKQYFGQIKVDFMPHVGVMPNIVKEKDILNVQKENIKVLPYVYEERIYDILFCGTYYCYQDKLEEIKTVCPKDSKLYYLYQILFENLVKDSNLSVWQGVIHTLGELQWSVTENGLKSILRLAEHIDWAIRMYWREQVISVLAKAGLNLYLLGRGWENHPASGMSNIHRINDRISYKETLPYMRNAKINLNVMPGFKYGTHDRIFNAFLQQSVSLTDSSAWIDNNFTDGVDIALYSLKYLEQLPIIAKRLLEDTSLAEKIIENGYKKVAENFTWSNCTDWILKAIKEENNLC